VQDVIDCLNELLSPYLIKLLMGLKDHAFCDFVAEVSVSFVMDRRGLTLIWLFMLFTHIVSGLLAELSYP